MAIPQIALILGGAGLIGAMYVIQKSESDKQKNKFKGLTGKQSDAPNYRCNVINPFGEQCLSCFYYKDVVTNTNGICKLYSFKAGADCICDSWSPNPDL